MHRFRPVLEDALHQFGSMIQVWIRPVAAAVGAVIFIDAAQRVFHEVAVGWIHEFHISGESSGDNGLLQTHCLGHRQSETFRTMEGYVAVGCFH